MRFLIYICRRPSQYCYCIRSGCDIPTSKFQVVRVPISALLYCPHTALLLWPERESVKRLSTNVVGSVKQQPCLVTQRLLVKISGVGDTGKRQGILFLRVETLGSMFLGDSMCDEKAGTAW